MVTILVCGASEIPTAAVATDVSVMGMDVPGVMAVAGMRLVPVAASSTMKVPLVGAAGLPFWSTGAMVR